MLVFSVLNTSTTLQKGKSNKIMQISCMHARVFNRRSTQQITCPGLNLVMSLDLTRLLIVESNFEYVRACARQALQYY